MIDSSHKPKGARLFSKRHPCDNKSDNKSDNNKQLAGLALLISSIALQGSAMAAGGDLAAVTKGSGSVNQLGGYNYNVALHVPPGTKGLQPNLGLVYNSQNSNPGVMGNGWALSGLSEIHHCGKTVAQHGQRGGVSFNKTDRLCLDGVPLVSSNGSTDNQYWSTSSDQYFYSLDEDWSRIEPVYSVGVINYFLVYTKDRRILRYGYHDSQKNLSPYGSSSNIVGRFLISEVTDRNGNSLYYNYTKSNETSRISSIVYNNRKVEFSYSSSDNYNAQEGYSSTFDVGGRSTKFGYKYRLDNIKMSVNNAVFKAYNLTYDTSETTGRYRLTQVEECTNVSGGDCITPAMQFSYNDYDWEADFQKAVPSGTQNQTWLRGAHNGYGSTHATDELWMLNGGANIIPGDFNGDGLADFIRQETSGSRAETDGSGGWAIGEAWTNDSSYNFGFYISQGDGYFDHQFPNNFGQQSSHKGYHPDNSGSGYSGSNIIPGDFNGDGKLDYMRVEYGGIAEDYLNTFRLFFNDGNDSDGFPIFYNRQPSGDDYQKDLAGSHKGKGASIHTGDFNGDGKTDFIRTETGSWADDSNGSFQVFLANDNTDYNGTFTRIEPNDNNEQADIRISSGGTGAQIIIADFDGDGKDDFIRQEVGSWAENDNDHTIRVYFSDGDGHFAMKEPTANNMQNLKGSHDSNRQGTNLIIGDYNGDGKADIMSQQYGDWANDTTQNLQLWFSRGDGTFDYYYDSNASFQSNLRGETKYTEASEDDFDSKPDLGIGARLITGDYNGDGRTDFIRQEMGNWVNDTSNTFQVFLSRGDGSWDVKTPSDSAFQTDLKSMHAIQCSTSIGNCPITGDNWFRGGADIIPGDYDGDGQIDFISRTYGFARHKHVAEFAVYFNPMRNQQPVDSLKQVLNGKAKWDISYDYMTQIPETIDGTPPSFGTVFRTLKFPAKLVSAITIASQKSSTIEPQQILYSYGQPIAGQASPFLGFNQMQEFFVQREKKIITDYTTMTRNGLYRNLATKIETRSTTLSGDPISVVNHQYEMIDTSQTSVVTRKVHTDTTQYLNATGVSESLDFDYDYYSNLLRTISTQGSNVTSTGYHYSYNTNDWQIAEADAIWFCDGAGTVNNYVHSCATANVLSVTGLSFNADGDVTQQREYATQLGTNKLHITNYEYDTYGNRTKITEPNGTVTNISYESLYDTYPLTKTIDPGGKNLIESYQYDAKWGVMTQLLDHNNVLSKTHYDGLGRLSSVEKADNNGVMKTIESQNYDWVSYYGNGLGGDLLHLNRTVYLDWDLSNSRVEGTYLNVLGQKVFAQEVSAGVPNKFKIWFYDADGRKVKELMPTLGSDTNWQYINYEYSVDGRMTRMLMPVGDNTDYFYEANHSDCNSVRSNLIKVRVIQGSRTRYRCVNMNDKDEKAYFEGDSGGISHISLRDKKGRLLSLDTGTGGSLSTFEYDLLDRKTKVTNSQRGTEIFDYDDAGFMTNWVHMGTDGTTLIGTAVLAYDALGRKTSVDYSDGKRVEYGYDDSAYSFSAGRLTSETVKQDGVQTFKKLYAYDRQGNINAKSVTVDGQTHLFAMTYSPQGNVTQMTYPSGRVIDYSYDGFDQIDTIKQGTTIYADYHGYNANGRYTGVSYNNGINENRDHDDNHRLVNVNIDSNGTSLLNNSISYTSYNEIATVTDHLGADDLSYTYSSYGYVTKATGPWGTENYSYHDNGDFITKAGVAYQYDSVGYLSTKGSTSFGYNKAGSLTSKVGAGQDFSYLYNDKQELIEVTSVGGSGSGEDTNVALGKTATQSSTYRSPVTVASKAIDGDTNGDFYDWSVTYTNADTNAWWQVDLGESHTVNQVVVYNRTDCCMDRLSNFNVDLLDASNNVIASQTVAGTAGTSEIINVSGSGVYKVRVQLNGTNFLTLAEVQVMGQISPADTNVALGKTATQSSQDHAERAVDGNTSGYYWDWSTTHTAHEFAPWWQVDLNGAHTVNEVVLYNRTDCCQDRLSNFNVDLLDAFNNIIASQTFAGTAGTTETINVSGSGVYKVRVQLNGTNPLSLAEVQVMGYAAAGAGSAGVTTFEYDGSGNRIIKVAPDGTKTIYVDEVYELQVSGSGSGATVLATDYIVGAEGRVASFTVQDNSSGFMAAAGKAGAFTGGSSLYHDMMANMHNTDTLAGTIGWAQHTVASYLNHPSAVDVVYMIVILPLLFSLVMFMVHYIRSANPSSGLRKMYNAVVNTMGKTGLINADTMARWQVQTGTEFMQQHRGLSLGAPIALVCMMFMVMPGAFVSTAYAAGGSPELGANATQYFHNDRIGNTIFVSDGNGAKVSKPVYKPFGEVYTNANNSGDDDSYRYGFGGKETDSGTGLMYFGGRYYDSDVGRFITADIAAIGSDGYRAAQLNRYAFNQNDPINMADPSGNLAFMTMMVIAFVVAATVTTASELISAKIQGRAVNWKTIGIGIAASAIMAPIGVGLNMGVAQVATSIAANATVSSVTSSVSASLVSAGISQATITAAATAASTATAVAIESALYSGISQGFGMALDSNASWSWRAFGLDIAFDVAFLGASYAWNNKATNTANYKADMESNADIRALALENANLSSNGRSLNRDLALDTIQKNQFDHWKTISPRVKAAASEDYLARQLRVKMKTNIGSASADQFARVIEGVTPSYRLLEEVIHQSGEQTIWTIKNESKKKLNML